MVTGATTATSGATIVAAQIEERSVMIGRSKKKDSESAVTVIRQRWLGMALLDLVKNVGVVNVLWLMSDDIVHDFAL
ncbi:hypothetical protein L1987_59606 [Smallanthus sonchifolius]|uniref:Uncharacterized protein n=1 Tax=Smallanthus sonchifolius TaxID=185202 RepID=A0ACB9D6J8_9ASTR|nr:hypothetical protein L1987_59606 [Smallanthus sonchifolius]